MGLFLQAHFHSDLAKQELGPLCGTASGWQQGAEFWHHAGPPLHARGDIVLTLCAGRCQLPSLLRSHSSLLCDASPVSALRHAHRACPRRVH